MMDKRLKILERKALKRKQKAKARRCLRKITKEEKIAAQAVLIALNGLSLQQNPPPRSSDGHAGRYKGSKRKAKHSPGALCKRNIIKKWRKAA